MTEFMFEDYDRVIPFLVDRSNVRGRITRLGSALDQMLSQHDYPESVSKLLAELMIVATLLGSTLKGKGLITLQLRGDGRVPLMVADVTHAGDIRGYASIDTERFSKRYHNIKNVASLLGKGVLVITYDYAQGTQRYQGVVPISTKGISHSVMEYFTKSEQIDFRIIHAIGKVENKWFAGGLMIQRMPELKKKQDNTMLPLFDDKVANDDLPREERIWQTIKAELKTLENNILYDPSALLPDLLSSLLSKVDIRVFDPRMIQYKCRCSRSKVAEMLKTLPAQDIAYLKQEGHIAITCQFCAKEESFSEVDLQRILKQREAP